MTTPGHSPPVLQVTYDLPVKWPLALRRAIDQQAKLRARDAAWATSELADLAFGVSTRLSYMPDIIDAIEGLLGELGEQLRGKDEVVTELLRLGAGFDFKDYAPVRRLLPAVGSVIAESRSCFEQLARFYRACLRIYLDVNIGLPDAYESVATASGIPAWANDLKDRRDDILHGRSLWLAFELREDQSPRYEPLFLLNWRPGQFDPKDCVTSSLLRRAAIGLRAAAAGIEGDLVQRVEAV